MNPSIPIAQDLQTDTWIKADWETFVALANDPAFEDGRGYFDQGYMRIEMAALGSAHGQDNSTVSNVVSLFATLKNIRIREVLNSSFWKTGVRACQPDIAVYIGDQFRFLPRNNSPISVDEYGAPTLAIEIGATSFKDDIGAKRLLYERLSVREYCVVNVEESSVIAFRVSQGNSGEIDTSLVLPGLEIAFVEEALKRSQTEDDGTVNRWIIQSFS